MSYSSSGSYPNYGATNPRQGGEYSSPSRNLTSRFHQLHDSISSNIFAINNGATALEQALKQLGGTADSALLREKIHNTQQTCNDTIGSTTKSLKELKLVIQKGDKQQRIQLERLGNEFRDTVERYSSLQKQVATKMKYVLSIKPQKSTSGWSFEEEGKSDEEQSLMEAEKLHQQRQVEAELEFEKAMLVEREQRIQQIEADMLDVNSVFRDLAALVHEQGTSINTIEANVESAADNIGRGAESLSKASSYQKKYRKKLCILVVILVIVVLIITLVIIFESKS